jgi:ribonuclease PH
MLYAIEVPAQGGNTLFASMDAAYAALPDAMKARLDTLNIPAKFGSDRSVAQALAAAAIAGALENVRINLGSIGDGAFRATVDARLRAAGVAGPEPA